MLDEYVEQSQLPDELGGFNGFNIFEWVEYTTVSCFMICRKNILLSHVYIM